MTQEQSTKSTKILVVDDEPDVQGMVKLKFRKQIRSGIYDFVFAENGKQALDMLKKYEDINIVISDINMPEMDGLTLLENLGELNRLLKAIIVSAYGDMDNIRTAMNRGAYDFVTKPIDFNDLGLTIEKSRKTLHEMSENIEALERAETSLKEINARNRAVIQSALEAIITIDDNGVIESANPACQNIFGFHPAELRGKNVTMIMPEEYRATHTQKIQEYISGGRSINIGQRRETTAVRANGEVFPIEISVSEFEINNKKMFMGIIYDITHRKQNEMLKAEFSLQLEKKVEERTRELKELNNEKNEILGVAAHDLKNPLSNIKMIAKMIVEDESMSRDEINEFSNDILSTSESMFDLIKNLLDANAIEQGKINIEFDNFMLSDVAENRVKFFNELAKAKNIKIITDFTDSSMVCADRSASIQVMDNLISNAIKYSPFDTEVSIKILNKDEFIEFSVADQGPGISEEEQKKLFKKFARLSTKPTGGEHSTGLGLSIVKKLVELMKGYIFCESKIGMGAKFIAMLPAAKSGS